ncbi:FAD/NAD(P)-binding domain-containing protein [Xylariaceae sp. FL0662B]|nr:FAD/NAD(P)-binding domain-containing protein [Xylariaceae sp. FL0662B]
MTETLKSAIRLDVIIIGAGISGLAAAIEIALSGHDVTVLEAAPGLHEVGNGIQITPNSTRILQRWGLSDELWASAAEPSYLAIHRYSGSHLVFEKDLNKKLRSKYGAPFIELHRVDLQKALYARARELGVQFRFGTRIVDINFDTGIVVSQSGLRAWGDLIVAADGLWSQCRGKLLPDNQEDAPKPTGDLAYRLVITLDQIQDPELREWVSKPSCHLWLGPRSHAVGYSLRSGTMYNIVLLVPDDLPSGTNKQMGSIEEMKALFRGWDPILNKFLDIVQTVNKWKLMHRREMPKWIKESDRGNFVFVGDSCHPMLPYLAQGANSAVEDGAVLGRLLGHVQSKAQIGKVLKMYERLRKPRGDTIVRETFTQRNFYHMVDGPEQQKRDEICLSQLGKEITETPFPIRWLCPRFQPWLFGYDAYTEVDMAVREDPF